MKMTKWKMFRQFYQYFRKYWHYELLFFFLVLLTSAASLASPYILKIIVDTIIPARNTGLLLEVLIILAFILLLRIASQICSDYLFAWISSKIVSSIRIDLFKSIIRKPLSYFHENKVGDLVHKINNEVDKIEGVLTNSLIRLVNGAFLIIGLIIMLSLLNVKLFLMSAMVFPFVFYVIYFFSPRVRNSFELVSKMESDLTSFFTERFNNVKLIKTFNAHRHEENKLAIRLLSLLKSRLKNTAYSSLNRNLSTFFIALGPLIVFGYGGSLVILSAMSLGTLIAFLQYLNRFYSPAIDLFYLHTDILRASVSMGYISELLSTQMDETAVPPRGPDWNKPLIVEKLHFSYADQPILTGINMTFKTGKSYAVVGASGCGKSTLLSLICRFLTSGHGNIRIGSIPLNEIDLETWMKYVTIVTQEYYIFHESVLDNIVYNSHMVTEEMLNEVIRAIGLDDMINKMRREGNMTVGDRGTTLSGGQCQRIAIARAILKGGEILILDEATSALDSKSENRILEHLKYLYREKIIIIISHRISAIKDVDEIFVINDGAILERGTHPELMNKSAYYRNLFHQQLHHKDEINS